MKLADEIREYTLVALIKPARRQGYKTVSFTALDVHKGMGIQENRFPAVCTAIDADKFLTYAKVTLVSRQGPLQSSSVCWTFGI